MGGGRQAAAAPPEPEIFHLVCDDGHTYDVVVNGNGAFTPGRVVGSTRVLVPTSFGEFSFAAVLPDGTVETETFPGEDPKGGGNVADRNPRPAVTCTFELTMLLEEEDPESGFPDGTLLTFGGEVTGFVTGR